MGKRKRFIYENKKEILAFVVLFVITVLLCVPFTMNYAVKVFGWAVWFYLVVGYFVAIFHCCKIKINLSKKSAILLVVSTFFILATLHVACIDKGITKNFADYIVGSYENKTVGGAIFGIVTSPFAVWLTYVWAIVVFMVCTAVSTFFFFRPFIFAGTASPMVERKKKKTAVEKPVFHEVILDEAPFLNKKPVKETAKPVAYMVEKDVLSDESDPYELLFGGPKESYSPKLSSYYNNPSLHSGIFAKKVTPVEEMSEKQAANALWGKQEQEILNDVDEVEEKVIFDDETDESIPDLLKPMDNPFLQALKQGANTLYAPAPIKYENVEEDVYSDDDREETAPKADTEVSSDYVYYQGKLVPVMKKETAFAPNPTLATSSQSSGIVYDEPIVEEEQPRHKIVQLVKRPDLPYNKPPLSILRNHVTENFVPTVDNWDELKEIFEVKLLNYKVEARFVDAIKGPTVTLCAIELGDKCPFSSLARCKDDLRRLLKSTKPITIIPQIPDTSYCGVEIPNEVKSVVGFKEIISSKEYREAKGDILIAMGKTAVGDILVEDLAAMPHALVAGETGSGKSVCLNVILSSIIFRYSPDEVKLLLIDLKEVEMAPYVGLPHMLLKEPLSDIPSIVNALKWIREEVVGRFNLFKTLHIRNLTEYNKIDGVEKLPRIVIVIDEASELMSDANARKTLESTLNSLARIARAAGIHLIFATQNPVKTVITNEIQNNLNTKIAFAVGDYNHSMVIFKAKGAESLLGRGDMYIKRGQDMRRAQCALVTTEEIEEAVAYIRDNNEYDFNQVEIDKILNGKAGQSEELKTATASTTASVSMPTSASVQNADDEEDETDDSNSPDLLWQALKICVDSKYVSGSFLQRKLKKGYNAIANLIEEMAAEGYITELPPGSKEKREILISREDFYREWNARFGVDQDHELENFDDGGDHE